MYLMNRTMSASTEHAPILKFGVIVSCVWKMIFRRHIRQGHNRSKSSTVWTAKVERIVVSPGNIGSPEVADLVTYIPIT